MIRPIDLQSTILAGQSSPAATRTEQGARTDAQAAQAAFAAQLAHGEEVIAPTSEVLGNRISAKEDKREKRDARERKNAADVSFEQVVDDAADVSEEPVHIIDFSA